MRPVILLLILAQGLGLINRLNASEVHESDSIKIYQILSKSEEEFNERNYTNAIVIAEEALEKSNDSNFIRGQAYAYFLIARSYHWLEEFDTAEEYYDKSLRLFIVLNDKRFLADLYAKKGQLLKKTARVIEAVDNYNQALMLYRDNELNDIKDSVLLNSKSDLLIDFGIAYKRLGNIELAIDYYLKSIEIKQMINDKNGIGICYGNIANLYLDLGIYQNAIKFFKLSYKYFEDINNSFLLEKVYTSLTNAYINTNNIDSATYYLDQAIGLNVKTENIRNGLFEKNLLAELEIRKGNINKGLSQYFNNIEYKGNSSVKDLIPDLYYNISNAYLLKNNYDSAKWWLEKGIIESEKVGYMSLKLEGMNNLSNYYASTKNYQQAFIHLLKFNQLKDSTTNSRVLSSFLSKQNEFQLDQNRNKIKDLEEDISSLLQLSKKYRKIIMIAILIIILLVVLELLLLKSKQNHKKKIVELENQIDILKKSRPYISKNKLSVKIR